MSKNCTSLLLAFGGALAMSRSRRESIHIILSFNSSGVMKRRRPQLRLNYRQSLLIVLVNTHSRPHWNESFQPISYRGSKTCCSRSSRLQLFQHLGAGLPTPFHKQRSYSNNRPLGGKRVPILSAPSAQRCRFDRRRCIEHLSKRRVPKSVTQSAMK